MVTEVHWQYDTALQALQGGWWWKVRTRYTTALTKRPSGGACANVQQACVPPGQRSGFPNTAVASAQEVRLTHRVGAPSRRCDSPSGHTSTWEVQASRGTEEHGCSCSCTRTRGWCPEASNRGETNSRGDAQAAERARTGGTKGPDKKVAPVRWP
jgi:hypothetical protein